MIHLKKILFTFLILITAKVFSQDRLHYSELQIGTDNDKFIAYTKTDRNYTYGINAAFRWRPNSNIFLGKTLSKSQGNYLEVGLNIKAYTPNYIDDSVTDENEDERPYAGWFYTTFRNTNTFNKSYYRLGIEVGVLGPASQAGQLQNWFHENVSGDTHVDWTGEIPNQLGVNIVGSYAFSIYNTALLDVYSNTEASIGSVFTFLWPQVNFRIGQFNKITESVATQNSVLAKTKLNEVFLEYGLGMKLFAYNATIQGNLFNRDAHFRENSINNTVFTMHLGLNFSFNRFSVLAKYQYGTGEFEQTRVHRYGMLNFLYRF